MTHVKRARARSGWLVAKGVLFFPSIHLSTLLWADAASAATGQWQAGARAGAAWLDGSGFGPSLEGYTRRGLTDSIDVDLQLASSVHPFQPDSNLPGQDTARPAAWALGITPGVSYRWDVLRAVPYLGLGLGGYFWSGGEQARKLQHFGASARFGVDYLLSRDVVLSVQANAHCVGLDGNVAFPWFHLGVGAAHAWSW